MVAIPRSPDLGRTLSELGRRISELETGRRLNNSAISDALIAVDADGVERARFGLLPDGSYGVWGTVQNTSTGGVPITASADATISMSNGAAGPTHAAMLGSVLTVDAYQPPVTTGIYPVVAWTPDTDLSVQVVVTGGLLVVTVSAALLLVADGTMQMGAALTGPAAVDFDHHRALAVTGLGGSGAQASYDCVFTGLPSGTYTVTAGYFLTGMAGSASFRSLIARPY